MTTCPKCQRPYDDGVRFCPIDGALVVPTADPSIARNIGRVLYGQFELRELAGRGATGTVWRAYQQSMDRIVAVKILHRELAADPDVVRRFLREARAIAKIAHPNIVTVHLVGETEDAIPYLVMEHVDGISLETIVEAQGPQAIGRVVHLGRQIAAGLGEAHANGIVHRDLKPANLIVTDRGRVADQVKILDFGIAKLIEGGEHSQLTRGQQIFGTPQYMAPEQATGEKVDARTDLYAFGVVLFRMVTGQVPFDAPAGMQVILRHLRDVPPRPRDLTPLVPPRLEQLILACLEKRPERRPSDAEDVIAALDEVHERTPTRERPRVAAPQATKAPAADAPSPATSQSLSGPMARPETRRFDRAALLVVGLAIGTAPILYTCLRTGDRPPAAPVAVPAADLAVPSGAPDLAIHIIGEPDRAAADLAVVDAAPDLAKKKRRHRDDDEDLPTTVFGPEK